MKSYFSITSIKGNEDRLVKSLKSLVGQSILPDKIYLNLCEEDSSFSKTGFPGKVIPDVLENFLRDHDLIELRWVKNLGAYTKLLPTLSRHWDEDCLIVTFDDDTYYRKNLFKDYLSLYQRYDCVVGNRGWTMYKDNLDYNVRVGPTDPLNLYNFHTGKGGVLFHPKFFKDVEEFIFDSEGFQKCSLYNDDIWFNLVRIKAGIKCYTDGSPCYTKDFTQLKNSLQKINLKNNKNNEQIKSSVKYLGL